MNSIINDEQLKTLLNLFSELGLCEKEDNISDEIDCYYQFSNISEKRLEVKKTFFEVMPENWAVRYYESEENIGSSIDVIRYFTLEEKKAGTNE